MEDPKDIFYLKQFVKRHPGNQMGWYLLGKQYLLAGKDGKANYCFLQAGEVYDAFENESHPLSENQLQQLRDWDKKQKKKRLARRAVAIAILLLLAAIWIPGKGTVDQEKEAILPLPGIPIGTAPLGVVVVPLKELRPIGYAWNSLTRAGLEAPKLTVAARMEEENGWRKWTGRTKLLMSVNREDAAGKLEVAMLDRDACSCEPSGDSAASMLYEKWASRQETHWTLSSAIYHYERKYKKWPEKLDDLIRPYPHNVLAGERNGMREMFADVLNKLRNDLKPTNGKGVSGTDVQPDQPSDGDETDSMTSIRSIVGTNGILDQEWSKPLEIIVDKAAHRLAVVQGNIIVRSYTVGLGGDETPEGSFYISEKVRNPNGRDDGVFGSRGMTLSNTLYAIHGTDDPASVGKDKSLGCVRMNKDDVEELFDLVPLGTIVHIKNGTLPSKSQQPAERFKLEPRQNETNPAKIYEWLT
ncbi:L,D-transpeptidase [Paenibacillus harenae]|uniref:L,D-transpeptidase n=1 Tax=Paenibacillus harenae TaxID=306543 RepID=UPI000417176C|nr:L,D-transpeptidase [Paenibacillus harenae]